jgi:hypothetical protein
MRLVPDRRLAALIRHILCLRNFAQQRVSEIRE